MSKPTLDSLLPSRLRQVLGHVLERVLNRTLALDPEAHVSLAGLEGRSVTLHLTQPPLALRLAVREGLIHVGAAEDAELEVRLRPASLAAAALKRDGTLPPGAVNLAGDADLARRLEKLARNYRPDLEAALTERFGDVLGMVLARGLVRALAEVRRLAPRAADDVAAWLRDEARLTPAREEIDEFNDDVDKLRERGERLAARLDALRARLNRARP